jgi:hypothetical protein
MGSQLTLLGAVLLGAGILLLAILLDQVVKRIRYRGSSNRREKPPASASIVMVIVALSMIILSQGMFWLSSQIRYFRPIRDDGILGRVVIERQDNPVKALKMTYTPMVGDSMGIVNSFYLSGDSWRFSGEMIGFNVASKFLGLPSKAYKTVKFNGRFRGRIPPGTSEAILKENPLEGGSSAAFTVFRDRPWLNWFASVDSFEVPYRYAERNDSFNIKISPEGIVTLRSPVEQAKAEIWDQPAKEVADSLAPGKR